MASLIHLSIHNPTSQPNNNTFQHPDLLLLLLSNLVAMNLHVLFLVLLLVLLAHSAPAQFIAHQPFYLSPNLNGTVVSDGSYHTCGQNIFTVPDAVFRRVVHRHRSSSHATSLAGNVVVVDILGVRVMVDTGVGFDFSDFPGGGHLFASMDRAGILPSSIDVILLTHAHTDHFLGLVTPTMTMNDGNNESEIINGTMMPAFPNARVLVHEDDHSFWSKPVKPTSSVLDQATLDAWSALYLRTIAHIPKEKFGTVRNGDMPIPGVTVRHAPGHSPGHAVFEFDAGDAGATPFIVLGDLWHFTELQVNTNVNAGTAFDTNSTRSGESRRRILRSLVERKNGESVLTLAFHANFPGLGYVRRRKRYGFDWIQANVGDLSRNDALCGVPSSMGNGSSVGAVM